MADVNVDESGDKFKVGILLKGGTVINAECMQKLDVLIEGDMIKKVSKDIPLENNKIEVIDCTDKYLMPGGIDLDTQGIQDLLSADDYADLSFEALKGGTTIIGVHITADKSNGSLISAYTSAKQAMESSSCCHVVVVACLHMLNENVANQIRVLVTEYGVSTFKIDLSDKKTVLSDIDLYHICILIKQLSSVLFVRCGDGQLSDVLDNKSRSNEITADLAYASMYRISAICKATNCPIILVNLSTNHLYEKAMTLKNELLLVSCNTSDLDYNNPGTWGKLGKGGIDFITSGPHSNPKVLQQHCVRDRMEVTWRNTVDYGVLSPIEFVNLVCKNPARLLNIYPKRGCIQENSHADIVVWSCANETNTVILDGRILLDKTGRFTRWPLNQCQLRIESGSEELYAKVTQRDQELNYDKAKSVMKQVTKMPAITLKDLNEQEKEENAATTGRRSLQKCGGRNLQESSFSLSGAQRDDTTPSRSSIRTHQPPGGKSSALW